MAVDLHKTVPPLFILLLWEVVGRLDLVASGALPAPSEILLRLWVDRADYPDHVAATLWASGAGFVIGNLIAVLAGLLFVFSPLAERMARGVNIAIFTLPPIAIAPILTLTLDGMTPRIVLAALGVYFVTMQATVTGLSQFDGRAADIVRAYGGGRATVLRLVQIRSAVPAILSGFRVAAPNAVLGAILAEFGGGGRFGLGTYLLGSLGRAEPERLWGIGLVATLIAGLSYGVFALMSHRMLGASRALSLNPAAPPASETARGPIWVSLVALLLPFAVWWGFLLALRVPEMLGKSPWGVVDYLFLGPTAPVAQQKLLAALAQTIPITLCGMAAGMAFAFGLAVAGRLTPGFTRAFLPVALVTQTMPLVALTPLLVLLLGRGTAVTLWITISVTFFPAYVMIAQGIAQVPRAALELPRAYGASGWRELRLVSLPASHAMVVCGGTPDRSTCASGGDDCRMAGNRPRAWEPAEPIARLSGFRNDLDGCGDQCAVIRCLLRDRSRNREVRAQADGLALTPCPPRPINPIPFSSPRERRRTVSLVE